MGREVLRAFVVVMLAPACTSDPYIPVHPPVPETSQPQMSQPSMGHPSIPPNYQPQGMGCRVASATSPFPMCTDVKVRLVGKETRHFKPPHNAAIVDATIDSGKTGARLLVVPMVFDLPSGKLGSFPNDLKTMGGTRARRYGTRLEVNAVHPSFDVHPLSHAEEVIEGMALENWCFLPHEGATVELLVARDVKLGDQSVVSILATPSPGVDEASVQVPEQAPITFEGACRVVVTIEGSLPPK